MGLCQPPGGRGSHGRKRHGATAGRSLRVATGARAVFLGSDAFSVPILDALLRHGHELEVPVEVSGVVTAPARPAGRGRKLRTTPVKSLAEAAGVPVLQPERARDAESEDEILALQPDVLVVASYGQILPSRLIEAPPRQSLNLHPSLLPRYRGSSPVAAAILAGDEVTGTTLMLMNAKMDAGPVIDQERLEVLQGETRGELEERLATLSAALLLRDLPAWLEGTIEAVPQDDASATYTRRIAKEDGRIDWNAPAYLIERQVRAYQPWPSAFSFWQDKQLRILKAEPREGSAEPGTVVLTEDEEVAIGTGDALLVLQRLQLAGGRPLEAGEFLRGYRTFVGSELG